MSWLLSNFCNMLLATNYSKSEHHLVEERRSEKEPSQKQKDRHERPLDSQLLRQHLGEEKYIALAVINTSKSADMRLDLLVSVAQNEHADCCILEQVMPIATGSNTRIKYSLTRRRPPDGQRFRSQTSAAGLSNAMLSIASMFSR